MTGHSADLLAVLVLGSFDGIPRAGLWRPVWQYGGARFLYGPRFQHARCQLPAVSSDGPAELHRLKDPSRPGPMPRRIAGGVRHAHHSIGDTYDGPVGVSAHHHDGCPVLCHA